MSTGLRKMRHRVESMRKHLAGKLLLSEPMSKHVTLGVGGPADAFFIPENRDDLLVGLKLCRDLVIPYLVVGNGSNILVRDGGFRGLVISTSRLEGVQMAGEDPGDRPPEVVSESGVLLSRLLNRCVKECLSGLEFAAGIPGSVGGAVVMNAGAHGSSLGDVLAWVEVADPGGEISRLSREDLECGYRYCRLPAEGVIVSAGFSLERGDETEILERVKWCLRERGKRLPFGWMNAGSIFKNPTGDHAGRIIDEMGFKGHRVGGAMISREHANVIINLGQAKARDIITIIEEVAGECRRKHGLDLEPEIRIVGEA